MTDLIPVASFDPVLQLETTTQALGGPGAVMNAQAQALLNRTEFLKEQNDALGDDADPAGGPGGILFSQATDYPAGSVGDRMNRYVVVTDAPFLAVADGSTDNTATVLAAAISVAPNGVVRIPYQVRFDYNTLLDDVTCPPNVQFVDESRIPVAGGAKLSGIFEKGDGTAVGDASPTFSSGHNSTVNLDNSGKSGSASGDKRISVLAWTAGRLARGARGLIRSVARFEMAQSAVDAARWSYVIRKRAPWAAVAAEYDRWVTGTGFTAGEYVFHANRYYVAASSGATGPTPPTHTSGTVSDGGVDWTYVPFNYDASVFYIDDLGRMGINTAPTTGDYFQYLLQDSNDSGPFAFAKEAFGLNKNVLLDYIPKDAGGLSTGAKRISVSTDGFTFLADGITAGAMLKTGFNQRQLVKVTPSAVNLDTTPTVLNIGSLLLNNSAATNVTTLDDGIANQQVDLVFANGNTTLVHSASFVLAGAVNVTPPIHSVITMRKVSYSSAWIEVSRSVK